MLVFSKDVDILRYEAALFGELHFPWQVLCEGTGGALSGTTFSKTGENFTAAGVQTGGVIYLQDSSGLDGAYEIVSVDSATILTVSVARADEDGSAVSPGAGSDVSYRVSTFAPQANEALFALTQYFGIGPGHPKSVYDTDDIMDTSVLKQASVYAIITATYATLAGRDGDDGFWKKSLYYQKLFEQSRQRCQLSIDIDGDQTGDSDLAGSDIRLLRD
jgi:hypothetical protein